MAMVMIKIFLLFCVSYFTSINGAELPLNICNYPTIVMNSSFELISPNFPSQYNDNSNCITIIHVPKGNKVTLTMQSFNTESGRDFLDIVISSNTYKSTGTKIILPSSNMEGVTNFTARFHTDVNTPSSGFKLSVIFTKLPMEIMSINGLSGVMNSSQFTYHNMSSLSSGHQRWNMSIELFFTDVDRCPGVSYIEVRIDSLPGINACTGTTTFYGKSISIIELKEIKSSLSLIQYKSFRYRGIQKCYPDFDCGNKKCVPMETVCNEVYDCDNDSDENNCESISEKPQETITFQNEVPKSEISTTEVSKSGILTTEVLKSEVPKIEILAVEASKSKIPTIETSKMDCDTHHFDMVTLIFLVILSALLFFAYKHLRNRDDGNPLSVSFKKLFVNEQVENDSV